MTDKPTPTDAEIIAVAATEGVRVRTGAAAIKFARAVLAKWGQPAQAAEPVAVVVPCYTPSGKRVALCSAKQDLPIGTKLYAAPQPVAREPLTDEQIKTLMQAHRTAMLMTCKARVPECGEFAAIAQDLDWLCESLGIKGGQHVE